MLYSLTDYSKDMPILKELVSHTSAVTVGVALLSNLITQVWNTCEPVLSVIFSTNVLRPTVPV